MAREFAKKLYNSKEWKKCRDNYFTEKFGLCELCDKPGEEVHHKVFLTESNINNPEFTLSHNNLILLCKNCHNAEHDRAAEMHRERLRKLETTSRTLCFDDNGDLVDKKNVFIVYGAPASGKTTYVKQHKGKYDIVFDLDYIISALSLNDNNKASMNDCVPLAIKLRECFYTIIENREIFFENAWITAGLPNKQEREKLAARLKAELIYIESTEEECIARAKHDDLRRDKQKQYDIIKYYFANFER